MSEETKRQLDQALARNIPTPCRWHPTGINALLLSPLEREEIIRRVEQVLEKRG